LGRGKGGNKGGGRRVLAAMKDHALYTPWTKRRKKGVRRYPREPKGEREKVFSFLKVKEKFPAQTREKSEEKCLMASEKQEEVEGSKEKRRLGERKKLMYMAGRKETAFIPRVLRKSGEGAPQKEKG